MLTTPGVYFEYVERGRPASAPLRTDIAAFAGYAARGPLLAPIRLSNWREFVAVFGDALPFAYLGPAVQGFFTNGGAVCYVVRVADPLEARPATVTLMDVDGQPALVLGASHGVVHDPRTGEAMRSAAQPVRFPSPGVWGTRIAVSVSAATPSATRVVAEPQSAGASYLDTLSGFEVGTVVRLTQGGHEASAYRRIVAVVPHRQQVMWDEPLTDLGLELEQPLQAEAVAFTLRIAFDGQVVETHRDLTLSPEHSRYAVRRLQADSALLDAVLSTNWPTDEAGVLAALNDPGRWPAAADNLPLAGGRDGLATVAASDFLAALDALAEVSEISLLAAPDVVLRAAPAPVATPLPRPVDCDDVEPLPPGQIAGRVVTPEGAPLRGVRVQPLGVNAGAANTPADGSFRFENLPLAQIALRFDRTGYLSLETTAQARQVVTEPLLITLAPVVTPPPLTDDEIAEIQAAMAAQGRPGYRVALLDPPETALSIDAIQTWRQRFDTSYAALYYPWVVVDGDEGARLVPPSGPVAGLIARTDRQTGPHRAPANARLDGVRALSHPVGDAEQGLLNPRGINCLRVLPGRGLHVYGARTVSSAAEWRYLNVRRLLLMIEQALEQSSYWDVFEPNNLVTRQLLRFSIGEFLETLRRQGALAGDTPEAAYRVRCDETNNPPDAVDAGQLVVDVAVAPAIPFEFIRFRLGRTVEAVAITE